MLNHFITKISPEYRCLDIVYPDDFLPKHVHRGISIRFVYKIY